MKSVLLPWLAFVVLVVATDLFPKFDPTSLLPADTGKRRVIVKRAGQCLGQKELPIFLPDMRIAAYNRTHSTIAGEVIFREDFPDGWSSGATIRKCDDLHDSSNCRPFLGNLANTDACTLLADSEAMYARYYATIQPKPVCPFRKGVYNVSEQLIDDGVSRFLPGAGSTFWEVRITGKQDNRLVMCIVMRLNVRPRRRF
ncbi:uncharacterized protein LOC118463121 [Anopheles albimanus]|uniref:uncharacterized protein LOC118463121 n=1 Tax=Anopheles albimanus TaxID=7167 RepID=UPI00163E50F7|nr:uncharacterized protein LOC118463121 [Anopheles albimanus]